MSKKTKIISSEHLDAVTDERFYSKIVVDQNTQCWIWQGKPNRNYGRIKVLNQQFYAHCFSYAKFVGENPNNLLVLHKCDFGMCVNPEHLFLGTPQDNMTDKVNKNRQSKGIKHRESFKNIKLTLDDIENIKKMRKEGKKLKEISEIYKVCFQHVSRIVNNKSCILKGKGD